MASSELPYDPRKTPDPDLQVPDLTNAIEGWRAWRVPRPLPKFGNPVKLYSDNAGVSQDGGLYYYWTPRRAARAECQYGCQGREIPGESCTCGFYAARTLEHLLTELSYHRYDPNGPEVRVLGQVAQWGKVIVGSQGWRAARAYPIRLWVPFEAPHLVKPLRAAYGCPVSLKNWIETPYRERSEP